MTDTNESKSIPSFLTMLILLLVSVVGIQTWYMLEMKQTLNAMQSEQSSSQLPDMDTVEAAKKLETKAKHIVVPNKNGTSPGQSEPVTQQTQADENMVTTDNSQPTEAPSLTTPTMADNGFLNKPSRGQAWNSHEEIRRMQQHMERVFNNRRYNPGYNRPDFHYRFRQNISGPEMDMREDQNQYMVLVNVAGADQKDISVKLDGQRLTVSGKQEYKKQDRDSNGHIVFSEQRSGRFQRSLTLHAPVENNSMQTRIDNGILRIIIAKKK